MTRLQQAVRNSMRPARQAAARATIGTLRNAQAAGRSNASGTGI